MKRIALVLTVLGGMLVAVVGVGTVSAATPVQVGYAACAFGGGNATVPAGSDVTVSLGVSWANRGRTQDFIHSQTTTATVNGTASNVSSDWMSPTRITGGYVSWLYVPVGTLANAGDSVVVQLQINVRHKIPSGKDPLTGKQLFTGPGDLLGPGTSCTITAV